MAAVALLRPAHECEYSASHVVRHIMQRVAWHLQHVRRPLLIVHPARDSLYQPRTGVGDLPLFRLKHLIHQLPVADSVMRCSDDTEIVRLEDCVDLLLLHRELASRAFGSNQGGPRLRLTSEVPRVTAIVPQFAHSELRPGRVVSGIQQAERREKSEATPVPQRQQAKRLHSLLS